MTTIKSSGLWDSIKQLTPSVSTIDNTIHGIGNAVTDFGRKNSGLWDSIKYHAPSIRKLDTTVGGIGGALAGLGVAGIKDYMSDDEEEDNKKYLRYAGGGALAGIGLGNLAGDRLRRYATNAVQTSDYGSNEQVKDLLPGSWDRFMDLAVRDKINARGKGMGVVSDAAREAWRRGMDLPIRDSVLTEVAPHTYTISPHKRKNMSKTDLEFILGRHKITEGKNDTLTREDRFDFDWHKKEYQGFKDALKSLLLGEKTTESKNVDDFYALDNNRRSPAKVIKSLLLRAGAQALLGPRGGAKMQIREHGGKIIGEKEFEDWQNYVPPPPPPSKPPMPGPPAMVQAPASSQTKVATLNPIEVIKAMADTEAWRQVPLRITKLLKIATDIKKEVQKAMEGLDVADPGYGYVYWHPQKNKLWAVLSDSDEQDAHEKWWKALSNIPGINKVITEAEAGPDREHMSEWVLIKKARIFTKNSSVNPFTVVGNAFGGPNAVTNSVVGALIGGGLGYGGGRIAEWFMPEKHHEDGVFSRNLAIMGAMAGSMPGVVQGMTHMGMNSRAGKPSMYRSWLQPTNKQMIPPNDAAMYNHMTGDKIKIGAVIKRSAKKAMDTASGFGHASMQPINVDRFNNAIWHDPYSPPALSAATAGVVSGIQQHYGGASVLSPKHFTTGLLAAGVDYMRASTIGGVLGALGGLKPEAQETLQQMGLWSGLLRGSMSSLLGQ